MRNRQTKDIVKIIVIVVLWMILCRSLWAGEMVDSGKLADAIYWAEGGDIAKPYGVLKDYCKKGDLNGQCRKGCIQTIEKWKVKLDYRSLNEFIQKFSEIYAPTKNAINDPNHLNENWVRNVKYFLTQDK